VPLFHLVVLALVQGITEFLPISSSGHLVLAWEVLDAQGGAVAIQSGHDRLIMDIAVHVGTLLAVVCYFRRDVWQMIVGTLSLLIGRRSEGARLAGYIILGTIPVVIAGFALRDRIAEFLRDDAVIAWTTIGFGMLLYVADRSGMTLRRLPHMRASDALVVGFMQILALVPGTSRSGITMTAARFLGYERRDAARFSLLLAIPAILGAGTLAGADLYESGNLRLGMDALVAAGFAFIAALAAIALMMRWLQRASFTPFVVYRLLLGALLLYLIYA
jgi:undecaprenyl-diphosphatase